jgi:hypothetical protein
MRPQGQKIVYYIGIIVGTLGGLLGMAVAIAAAPLYGSIFSLFFILVFGFVFGGMFLRSRRTKQLLQNGRRASGKIIEMWDTAVTINNQPQIGMVIEVFPDTGSPFKTEVKQVISRLQTAYYQVGVYCVVRYDPNNKKTVAIESIGSGLNSSSNGFDSFQNDNSFQSSSYFPGKNQQQIESELLGIEMEAKRILNIGIESRAIVKRMDNTNVFVNGNFPLYSFTLEVIPNDSPAYEAKVKGLVMEASIPKYQPGCQIFVKYDPADKSKITLFHS